MKFDGTDMRVHPMARCHSSTISRVGIAATLMFFFQGRIRKDMFNFPTERLSPMNQEELENGSEEVSGLGFVKSGELFKANLEIPQCIVHRAVCDGMGWSLGSYPKRVIEITGPYDDVFRVKVESEFDSLTLKSILVETVHDMPKELFQNIIKYGLKTIMGNVVDVSIYRVWTHSQAMELTITFEAEEQE
jgi:hypothetical protein